MTKILILTTCPACNGRANVSIGEATSPTGQPYLQHKPCSTCDGSGNQPKWISLEELAHLLQSVQYNHEHTSFTGSMSFYPGEVLDTLVEVCDDCNSKL